MNTYLGAAQDLSPADIDEAQIAASSIVYLEGYLWDPKNAKEAFVKAAKIAHERLPGRIDMRDGHALDRAVRLEHVHGTPLLVLPTVYRWVEARRDPTATAA